MANKYFFTILNIVTPCRKLLEEHYGLRTAAATSRMNNKLRRCYFMETNFVFFFGRLIIK